MLNGLDLFSGIGGISLALAPWVRTVCYVEIDRYCQAVLKTRFAAGDLEAAPIWDDVTTFDPKPWAGAVDIISGGFPCQDISLAGNGAGLEGERSGLFFEIIRIASVIRPSFLFLENVPAVLTRGGGTVISEIASLGYDTRWGILSAFDVGAPHLRERWWCIAANTEEVNACVKSDQGSMVSQFSGNGRVWDSTGTPQREVKPSVCRAGNDIPSRMDRIEGLGNSVVPLCAREAFERLMDIQD